MMSPLASMSTASPTVPASQEAHRARLGSREQLVGAHDRRPGDHEGAAGATEAFGERSQQHDAVGDHDDPDEEHDRAVDRHHAHISPIADSIE